MSLRAGRPGVAAIAALFVAFNASAGDVHLGSKFPFARPESIPPAVLKGCHLETNLPQYVAAESGGRADTSEAASGRTFKGWIAELVVPAGGAWDGRKSVLVQGELSENGKVIGTVAARRNTRQGGYEPCQMLNYAARAVARDLAGFLAAPSLGAKLGDEAPKD